MRGFERYKILAVLLLCFLLGACNASEHQEKAQTTVRKAKSPFHERIGANLSKGSLQEEQLQQKEAQQEETTKKEEALPEERPVETKPQTQEKEEVPQEPKEPEELSDEALLEEAEKLYTQKQNEDNYKNIVIKQEIAEDIYIPVLMYHHFTAEEVEDGNGAIVNINEFEEQIKTLLDNGYTFINLEQLNGLLAEALNERLSGQKNKLGFGSKYICITIDDGYRSNYDLAYPLLKKYQIKADISVITSRIHTSYVTVKELPKLCWEDLNKMQDSGLVTIYNHTYDHKEATKVTMDEFLTSVTRAEEMLDKNLDTRSSIKVLTYPNGSNDLLTRVRARELGYDLQLTTAFGVVTKNTMINEIPRVTVNSGLSGEDLLQKIRAAAQRTINP